MLNTKELNRKVAGIRKSAKAIRENIHEVLVNLAGHAYEHGDVSVAINLLDATKGVDKVAVVKYLREHCFTTVKSDGTVKLNKAARKDADFVDGDAVVQHLIENVSPWYDDAVSTEAAAKILDPAKRIEALAKQVTSDKYDAVKISHAAIEEALTQLKVALQIRSTADSRTTSEVKDGRAIELQKDGVPMRGVA